MWQGSTFGLAITVRDANNEVQKKVTNININEQNK